MAVARSWAVALTGLVGDMVEVECDISAGLPGMSVTGRVDASVTESRDRLRAACHNCGISWPDRKITVALLPVDVRKVGSRFDLAIGMALLAAAGVVPVSGVASAVWIGEIGLDGALRPVRGVLPSVLAAQRAGVERVVVPRGNAAEAALVAGVDVRTADDLGQVVAWLAGSGAALDQVQRDDVVDVPVAGPDLLDVSGQFAAKRALEIAAAGGHHLYLVGAPGVGKTMLAERLTGLLPPLSEAESLEVTAVHSIAGLLSRRAQLVCRPPLQAPHHTASVAALVGGGSFLARPGAISLAHHGVLFLDEAAEFSPTALDALRQPLETGTVTLHRGGGVVAYPARFQLVLAANPCACTNREDECSCSPQARRRHQQRLSGPLMDRIDLRVRVEAVPHGDFFEPPGDRESSAEVATRVALARARAALRWDELGYPVNAVVPGGVLRDSKWRPAVSALSPARDFLERGDLSARGFDRVLRTAWTIADLNAHEAPTRADVSEALHFRIGQVSPWAA